MNDLGAIVNSMSENEYALRRLLWLRHGCSYSSLYGDDGEMRCNECNIDFLRYNINYIEKIWYDKSMNIYKKN
jgi:hypothetical protein